MINARMTESTTCRLTNNCDTPNLCFLSFRFKGYKHVSNYLIPTCSPHGLIDHIPSLHYSNLLFLPRIDAFELLCWRKLMRILWTARRSNQWILKEIIPTYSLEGLIVEAEAPILWPHDAKSWLIRKDPDAGKDWGQEEKGTTEDEMVRWYHRLDGCELGQTEGDGEGQRSLVCCSPWGHKKWAMIWRLNNSLKPATCNISRTY